MIRLLRACPKNYRANEHCSNKKSSTKRSKRSDFSINGDSAPGPDGMTEAFSEELKYNWRESD